MEQNSIQDLRSFDQIIFDIIQDYIVNITLYSSSAMLIINPTTLELNINEDDCGDNPESILVSSLTRIGEDGHLEPDIDATFELASKYIFVR